MRHKSRLRRLVRRQHRRETAFWDWALPQLDGAELERLRGLMGQYRNPAGVPVGRLGGDDLALWARLEELLCAYHRWGLWS